LYDLSQKISGRFQAHLRARRHASSIKGGEAACSISLQVFGNTKRRAQAGGLNLRDLALKAEGAGWSVVAKPPRFYAGADAGGGLRAIEAV
jgi:hypothetical protein